MRGFYSLQPRGWGGRRSSRDTGPAVDPYSPALPHYAQRNRSSETEIAPGVLRIDLGEPLPRLAHEPPTVTRQGPEVAEAEPEPTDQLPAMPSVSQIAAIGGRDWRDDYGVARDR